MPSGMIGWEVVRPRAYLILHDVVVEEFGIVETEKVERRTETRRLVLDVIRYADTFSMNDIPQASVTVALGRRADSLTASEIHYIQNTLTDGTRAEVWLEVDSDGSVTSGVEGFTPSVWPDRRFRIFWGNTVSCNYNRGSSGVEFTIGIEHWLAQLNKTSVLSEFVDPSTVVSASAPLAINAVVPGVVAAGTAAPTVLSSAGSYFSGTVLGTDMWGGTRLESDNTPSDGLLGWLMREAQRNTIRIDPAVIGGPAFPAVLRTNRNALEALRLFEPTAVGPIPGYVSGVPIALRGRSTDDISTNIINNISLIRVDSLRSQTFWDVLLRISAQYMCAVVPRVETALFVPYLHGVRQTFKTITAAEIADVKQIMLKPNVIRAVALNAWQHPLAGSHIGGAGGGGENVPPRHGDVGLGGWYQGSDKGVIRFYDAPPWLVNLIQSRTASSTLLGDSSTLSPTALAALSPLLLNPAAAVLAAGTRAARDVEFRDIRNEYARALYVHERLRYRQMEIATRLRFDIAPGSSVQVEGAGEQFLGSSDELSRPRFANVVQVSNILDAENASAGTIYKLTHTRNVDENAADATSLSEHPIWRNSWLGAKLIDSTG